MLLQKGHYELDKENWLFSCYPFPCIRYCTHAILSPLPVGLFSGDEESRKEKEAFGKKVFSDQEIATIIDIILSEDDMNGDGSVWMNIK